MINFTVWGEYSMVDVEKSLLGIFEEKGIYLSENEKDDELEMDSLQFISIVVDMENVFSIIVDDEDLMADKFKTFNSFLKYVEVRIAQPPELNDDERLTLQAPDSSNDSSLR